MKKIKKLIFTFIVLVIVIISIAYLIFAILLPREYFSTDPNLIISDIHHNNNSTARILSSTPNNNPAFICASRSEFSIAKFIFNNLSNYCDTLHINTRSNQNYISFQSANIAIDLEFTNKLLVIVRITEVQRILHSGEWNLLLNEIENTPSINSQEVTVVFNILSQQLEGISIAQPSVSIALEDKSQTILLDSIRLLLKSSSDDHSINKYLNKADLDNQLDKIEDNFTTNKNLNNEQNGFHKLTGEITFSDEFGQLFAGSISSNLSKEFKKLLFEISSNIPISGRLEKSQATNSVPLELNINKMALLNRNNDVNLLAYARLYLNKNEKINGELKLIIPQGPSKLITYINAIKTISSQEKRIIITAIKILAALGGANNNFDLNLKIRDSDVFIGIFKIYSIPSSKYIELFSK